jgi:hypothetical protein
MSVIVASSTLNVALLVAAAAFPTSMDVAMKETSATPTAHSLRNDVFVRLICSSP